MTNVTCTSITHENLEPGRVAKDDVSAEIRACARPPDARWLLDDRMGRRARRRDERRGKVTPASSTAFSGQLQQLVSYLRQVVNSQDRRPTPILYEAFDGRCEYAFWNPPPKSVRLP
jgi:hypothetical protein